MTEGLRELIENAEDFGEPTVTTSGFAERVWQPPQCATTG